MFSANVERVKYITIPNWEKFQHYKDRKPYWIKVYIDIIDEFDENGEPKNFYTLPDSAKLTFLSLLCFRARFNCKIPYKNSQWLAKQLGIKTVNLEPLENIGCIKIVSDPYQVDTESLELEKEKEKEKDIHHFEKFWNLYPRKVGKDAALKAFKKLTESEMTLAIEKIPLHTASWKKRDKEHIPHASTWLNGRRWEDEIQTSHEDQGRVYKAASEVFKDLNL